MTKFDRRRAKRSAREKKKIEREKQKDKLRMLRKSPSGSLYYNLIERLDLYNPTQWEYVNIKS